MGAMPLQQEYFYPESDGQPMAETSYHWDVMVDTAQALRDWYAQVPDVWVGSNLFLYYQQRTPGIAPDVFAVRGVAKKNRRTFKVWEEGHAPFFVLEATSESTRDKDEGQNKAIYEAIGVQEYFLFDPLGEYLNPRLQGLQLTEWGYQRMPCSADGAVLSRTTGLLFRPEGLRLRLVDATTGTPLLWHEESVVARRVAEERAEQAAAQLQELAAELARLRCLG
jgi:Uma2 family endonuclease